MSPAERLLFRLHKHFSASEMATIEDRANEIQNFLYVNALKEFSERVKQLTGELLVARRLENTALLENAIEALKKEVIIAPASMASRRKTSVLKSCLRQSGELKAQTPGERLEERLGRLLEPKIVDLVIYRADNISSKEDLDDLVAYLRKEVLDWMATTEANAKDEVALALSLFCDQIVLKERQTKEVMAYMEVMRRTVKLILQEVTLDQETKDKLFEVAKEIEADFSSIEDNDLESFAVKLRQKIETLKAMTSGLSGSVTGEVANKIKTLEEATDSLLGKL